MGEEWWRVVKSGEELRELFTTLNALFIVVCDGWVKSEEYCPSAKFTAFSFWEFFFRDRPLRVHETSSILDYISIRSYRLSRNNKLPACTRIANSQIHIAFLIGPYVRIPIQCTTEIFIGWKFTIPRRIELHSRTIPIKECVAQVFGAFSKHLMGEAVRKLN